MKKNYLSVTKSTFRVEDGLGSDRPPLDFINEVVNLLGQVITKEVYLPLFLHNMKAGEGFELIMGGWNNWRLRVVGLIRQQIVDT